MTRPGRTALAAGASATIMLLWILAASGQSARRELSPVTDAVLASPSPNDWMSWRGTSKSLGYSPLDQINRGNVSELRVAWAWNMEPGTPEAAPIVHDGVLFLAQPGGIVQALDGAIGDLLWEYTPPPRNGKLPPKSAMRGMAIYGDKVFVNVPDGRLVALDAHTGAVAWATEMVPADSGFRFSTAPVIAKGGVVVSAMDGCSRYIEEKCAIVAHDADTGQLMWRTPTIPDPGTPGSDSWGDVPHLYRAGTEMWIPGSYDPELHLVYWSTSQPKPWTRVGRGTDGAALYSNSTLALDPETGDIVWYRQTLPGETHDLDEVFENVLVDAGSRQSLFKMGKMSILWEIDRRTGRILHATDLGLQNVLDLDPDTGEVTYRPDMMPKLNEPIEYCPGPMGGKNWPSMAYSPKTEALYIPYLNSCVTMTFVPVERKPSGGGPGFGAVTFNIDPRANGNMGSLVALDLDGNTVWRLSRRVPFVSATLATAGDLLFVADHDRYFYALDIETGAVLWQNRLATTGHGFPASYAIDGRQYIAIPTGYGAPWVDVYGAELLPEITPSKPGNALVVFALPAEG